MNVKRLTTICTLLIGSLVLSGCISTATYGTGKSQEAQLLTDLGGVVFLGSGKEKEKIDYKERSPLVIPASTQAAALPSPQEAAALPAGFKDESVTDPEYTGLVDLNGNPIKRSELSRYNLQSGEYSKGKDQSSAVSIDSNTDVQKGRISAKEWKEQEQRIAGIKAVRSNVASDEVINKRQFLTDPPVGYRQPTNPNYIESAQQTAQDGNGKKKKRCVWPFCRKNKS